MKGYLNNLSQRTLNMGNRVEPRLPSLFEPQAERQPERQAERVAEAYQEEITTETHQIASPQRRREQTRREQTVAHREPSISSDRDVDVEDTPTPEVELTLESPLKL